MLEAFDRHVAVCDRATSAQAIAQINRSLKDGRNHRRHRTKMEAPDDKLSTIRHKSAIWGYRQMITWCKVFDPIPGAL